MGMLLGGLSGSNTKRGKHTYTPIYAKLCKDASQERIVWYIVVHGRCQGLLGMVVGEEFVVDIYIATIYGSH